MRSLLVETAQRGVVNVVDPQAAVAAAADRLVDSGFVPGSFTLPTTVAVTHPIPEDRDLRIPLGLGVLGVVTVLGAAVLRGVRSLGRR